MITATDRALALAVLGELWPGYAGPPAIDSGASTVADLARALAESGAAGGTWPRVAFARGWVTARREIADTIAAVGNPVTDGGPGTEFAAALSGDLCRLADAVDRIARAADWMVNRGAVSG